MPCLFTYDALDGAGCAVIAHLAYPDDLDVRYCSCKTINDEVNAYLNH